MTTTHGNEKQSSQSALVEEIQLIIQHWIRISNIKLGWIQDFDKIIVKYVTNFFMFEIFLSSFKLLKTFTGHTNRVNSIDWFTFNDRQFICSGSHDQTARVWDVETNQQIHLNGHSNIVYCAKFSQYHYHNHNQNVICSSSNDIRFWNFKDNKQLQLFNEHTGWIGGIEFSPFNGGRYLCSGSEDKTIRLWDVETSKSLHVFNGHTMAVRCLNISPLQSNNNKTESNHIGVIGGNGYTICSGSWDKTIRIWDIETVKQFILFKGHEEIVLNVKYGSNELKNIGGANTILSGSNDTSTRLWDIRSGQQIEMFSGHTGGVTCAEYSPFIVNNIEVECYSNVICSGSFDNTIRFWDIRSNKSELYVMNGEEKKDDGIKSLIVIVLACVMVHVTVQLVFGDSIIFQQ
ncbi:WD-40 repeat protein [Reticulomyxa filosa]|uniref:WD-40 repeat protein n=1 Tax=Reticulomyxa filosa TaxID=46433 RepID=X6P3N5_RETFI|nr:WD-40 repeat protein [Reticulomyxa filosa]|eukprot:ETO32699.1 WD-40 repeat protein [Reticulomyxa filosa]